MSADYFGPCEDCGENLYLFELKQTNPKRLCPSCDYQDYIMGEIDRLEGAEPAPETEERIDELWMLADIPQEGRKPSATLPLF